MSLLPDLPPARRTHVPLPVDGVERAVAAGRARRTRALAPMAVVVVALAVVGAAQTLRPSGAPQTVAAPLPASYLAYSLPVAGGQPAVEVRSAADGALLRALPYETQEGQVTGVYDVSAGAVALVRRPGAQDALRVCGGSVVLVDAGTGTERRVVEVPPDRSVTAVALSSRSEQVAYALTDCVDEAQVETDVELHVRDLGGGQEQVGRRAARVEALAWAPDDDELLVVGADSASGGSGDGQVVGVDDLDGRRAVLRGDPGCGFSGAAWTQEGLFVVTRCGSDGDDPRSLQRFTADGASAEAVGLPACSLGVGLSADAGSGAVLVWVNSSGDCEPVNRLLVLRDGSFVDLPRPSPDRVYAANW